MPLKKKVKKKPASSGLSRKYDTKHVGHEMEFGNIDFNTIANAERNILLHQALAWYAYMYDIKKDFKEPVKSYLLGLGWSKSDVSALNHVRWEFESAGAMKLIRMTQMGWQLNESESAKVDAFVNRLKGMAQEYRVATKTPTVEATRVKKFDDQDPLGVTRSFFPRSRNSAPRSGEFGDHRRLPSSGWPSGSFSSKSPCRCNTLQKRKLREHRGCGRNCRLSFLQRWFP